MFLGVDLGTSGIKVTAVRADGSVVAQAEAAYEVDRPAPGYAQIDPELWYRAFRHAMGHLPAMDFVALGVVGQMHGLVLLAEDGTACGPAMLWPDRRAEPELARWRDLAPDQRTRLANPLTPGMAGPMLSWVQRHEPERLARAQVAVQPKDFLRSRLTGSLVGDRSDASATLLWDVLADGWAHDVIEALGLPPHVLPEACRSDAVVGTADLPGSPAVVAGAGDTPAALLGSGGLSAGEVQINIGTGVQILLGVDNPQPAANPVTHLYADAGSAWYAMVALQNGGLALDRFRQWLGMQWADFFAAAQTQPDAGGVSVLPFLTGERGSVAGPDSRGAWLGLNDATTAATLARAAIEAMVFSIRRGLELLGAAPASVRITGGGARHRFVPQLIADTLQVPVHVLPDRSASALGAAVLAASGVGEHLGLVREDPVAFTPGPGARLQSAYEQWVNRLVAADL
jgi:xylulokinase